MTGSGFVSAGEDCIDNTQMSRWTNSSFCDPFATAQLTIFRRRIFERADDRCSNCNDTTATLACDCHCFRCRRGNAIRLVERQQSIEIFVAGR